MANRVAATYSGNSLSGGIHTINFTAPRAGARLILLVSAWNALPTPNGWEQDYYTNGFNHLYAFSKIATGSETSVRLAMDEVRLHAVIHERDDCPEFAFSAGGTSITSSVTTSASRPSAIKTGRVFGWTNSPGGSASATSWNLSLARHFAPDAASSSSAFAHGPMPAGTDLTYTVSGFTPRSDAATVVAVVGYGTTDAVAPTSPGNLRTTSVSGTAITIEWDAASDNVGVAGYGIYRDGSKQGADQTSLSHTFSGLTPGQSYVLGVDATDMAGNRSARATLSVTAEVDVTPPTVPGQLRLVAATHNSLSVAWDPSTDNTAVAGYGVYVDGVRQGPDQGATSFVVTRLARDTAYLVEVDAADAMNNRSAKASLVATTAAGADPSAPQGLTAAAGSEQITLAWRPAEAGAAPIARYEVLLDGVRIAATTALGYVVEDLDAGAAYEVAVRAVDRTEVRGPSATVSVTVPASEWVPVASPVYRLGSWVGNARDRDGVTWAVAEEDGWSSSPQTRSLGADSDASDGGFSGPGRYGPRVITLSGTATAPSRAAMLAAQERLTGRLSPRDAGVLRVAEAHLTRQARVRLEDQVEITDRGSTAFEWTITLKAGDPRRYKVRSLYAEAVFAPAQTQGSTTITLDGDYPDIPARLRLVGPVKDPVIRLDPLGLEIRAKTGTVLPDARYALTIDLATRAVWAIVPPEVWPEPRPARGTLAVYPARFWLQPGVNTLTLSGGLVAGQEDASPRLVVETTDAWI
ncbi:fibronectin type III domain-containing protein [Nonomuraea dietziae]|uniref:fibronectin type III domain-containing protein n=1 Tax=Nonomuraea dietziae TaxID=65515 RepID=UPI0033D17EB3